MQNLQRDALIAAGVDPVHLYEDQASGMREDRPGLTSCLKALRTGDTLVVWKLDRLGRDLRHLINTVHDLTGRGIGLKVLTGHGAAIDTTTAAGKLVFGIFAALAEFGRESWVVPAQTDDAFISYRYARNLVDGLGLVYNAGERVEGMTNLFWTLLVAAGLALGFEAKAVGHALGVARYERFWEMWL